MSARQYDGNGYFEIPKNPISKVGVFPYLGSSIGAPPEDANKVFMVYRPAEELSDPECLASFRLTPWVDDHEMLGDEADGLTPAEQKGVHGVIGENLSFEGDTLYANVKVFSSSLGRKIAAGKKDVSLGYRCYYEFTPGTFRGQPYDAVQRGLRGNHIASVNEGRMGPEVAVLDQKMAFTVDAKDIPTMDPETLAKLKAAAEAMLAAITDAMGGAAATPAPAVAHAEPDGDEPPADTVKAGDADDTVMGGDADDTVMGGDAYDTVAAGDGVDDLRVALDAANKTIAQLKKVPVMDAKAIAADFAARDKLAERLKPHIGAFDHAEMDLAGVAKYGCAKLELAAPAGAEAAMLDGYLKGRPDPEQVFAAHSGQDAADAPTVSFVDRAKAEA